MPGWLSVEGGPDCLEAKTSPSRTVTYSNNVFAKHCFPAEIQILVAIELARIVQTPFVGPCIGVFAALIESAGPIQGPSQWAPNFLDSFLGLGAFAALGLVYLLASSHTDMGGLAASSLDMEPTLRSI